MSYWVKQTDYVPFFDFGMHGEGGFKERESAFHALKAIGAPAVPALCEIMENKNLKWDRRWRAEETLGEIGPPAKAASGALIRALNDPTFPTGQRYCIVLSIAAIGAAGECATDLTHFLEKRHAETPLCDSGSSDFDQFQTISVLGRAGAAAAAAVPVLVEMLRDYEKAIANPKHETLPARPEERKAAEQSRELLRDALVEALGKLGAFDPRALPAVMDLRNDPSARVRGRVAEAFIQLGKPDDALTLLDALANDPDVRARRKVIETLGTLSKAQSASSLPRLMKMLGDNADEVRSLAAEKLGDMGSAAEPALDQLKPLAKDQSERVRIYAQQAIGKINRSAKER